MINNSFRRLLSASWRGQPNCNAFFGFEVLRDLSPRSAPLGTPSCCKLYLYSSSATKPQDEEEKHGRQETRPDPFGLGDVVESAEKSSILVQGFYPETGSSANRSQHQSPPQQRQSQSLRDPQSESKVDQGNVWDPDKQDRLNQYDSWIRSRNEQKQSEKSPDGEAEAIRSTTYGRIRMDSDNFSPSPSHSRFQLREEKHYGSEGKGRDYNFPKGENRAIARDREEYRQSRHPSRESFEGPITETIEADHSVRMRASDFLKHLRSKTPESADETGEEDDSHQKGKVVIEKIMRAKNSPSENIPEPDYSQVVKDPSALDSHQLPNEYRLPEYNALTHQDMWNILKHTVIFQNDFILAINKPSGVPVHSKSLDCRHVIIDFANKFADLAKCKSVYPLHRLDKETTGVLLFAKDEKIAAILKKKFANRQIDKVYLAAAKLCPKNPEGTIKIPIGEGLIPGTNKYRQVLRPDLREYGFQPTRRSVVEAITNYRVLHSIREASFLEIEPVTGYKHQIRVHLGLGLGTPVIGDHKYSHRDRLAPQRLHPFLLHRIKVRQSKVRNLPLHLHCNKVSFTLPPEFTSSTEPVYIHAKIPLHMRYTLKRLGLIG